MLLKPALVLLSLLLLLSPSFSSFEEYYPEFPDTINAVVGDISFVQKFKRIPTQSDSDIVRITTHLEYIISKLENTQTDHLSNEQRVNRKEVITHLKEYAAQGEFPKNYDYKDTHRPTFIDKDGNICAVGYLVAQTVGLEVAESLNEEFKYDYIYSMDSPVLKNWLIENGLTTKEAAMIQPAYGPAPDENYIVNDIEPAYAITSGLLAGAQLGLTGYGLFSDASFKTQKRISLGSAGLGIASATLGLINLDNTKNLNVGICCFVSNLRQHNISRRNLSIANITFGSLSAAFNGLQYFSLRKEESHRALRVTTTQLYVPEINAMTPALNVNWRF